MQIQQPDTDVRQYIRLDNLRTDEPWLCIRYAAQHNLMTKPGWEWIPKYIELDESLCEMIHTYRASVLYGQKYEFGVEIPTSDKNALLLDKNNGNTLWKKSIDKELLQIIHEFKSFCVLEANDIMHYGYKKVPYHLIFACKVDLRRKTRLVIDGNRSPPVHKEDCYAPLVSVEAIQLGFLLAQMNDLKCVAGDVGNEFLTSYTTLYVLVQ